MDEVEIVDLFGDVRPAHEEPVVPARRKRTDYTARNNAVLAQGRHPATLRALLDPPGSTCGGCIHAEKGFAGGKGWLWKCNMHRLGMSRSEASDIRVGWPACTLFEARP